MGMVNVQLWSVFAASGAMRAGLCEIRRQTSISGLPGLFLSCLSVPIVGLHNFGPTLEDEHPGSLVGKINNGTERDFRQVHAVESERKFTHEADAQEKYNRFARTGRLGDSRFVCECFNTISC